MPRPSEAAAESLGPAPLSLVSGASRTPAIGVRTGAASSAVRSAANFDANRRGSSGTGPRFGLSAAASTRPEATPGAGSTRLRRSRRSRCRSRRSTGPEAGCRSGPWARPAAWSGRRSAELAVLVAEVGGVGELRDDLGVVVVAAQQAGLVEVEGLLGAVGVDLGREADVEAAPGGALVDERLALGDLDAGPLEQERRVEVVPHRVAGEVERVEVAPAKVAKPREAEELGPGVLLLGEQLPLLGLRPHGHPRRRRRGRRLSGTARTPRAAPRCSP